MTHLVIAGHGKRRNGSYDSGATGFIKEGENKFVKNTLFPAMKKYVDGKDKVVFFDAYNVYSYGNIVSLARKYGSDVMVTEVHFDASKDESDTGGHVIVYDGFKPDSLDLRLRNAINKNVGVRYTHKGHRGIKGRSNLANVNRTAKSGVNYRLIELGFGTNKHDSDVMKKQTDKYAKDLVGALLGKSVGKKPNQKQTQSKPSVNGLEWFAEQVKKGVYGNGHKKRKAAIYKKVRDRVNGKGSRTAFEDVVNDVKRGVYGNGHENRANKIYSKVRDIVNR